MCFIVILNNIMMNNRNERIANRVDDQNIDDGLYQLLLSQIYWPSTLIHPDGTLVQDEKLYERLYPNAKPMLSTSLQYVTQDAHDTMSRYYSMQHRNKSMSLSNNLIDIAPWSSSDFVNFSSNALGEGKYGSVYRATLQIQPDRINIVTYDKLFCPSSKNHLNINKNVGISLQSSATLRNVNQNNTQSNNNRFNTNNDTNNNNDDMMQISPSLINLQVEPSPQSRSKRNTLNLTPSRITSTSPISNTSMRRDNIPSSTNNPSIANNLSDISSPSSNHTILSLPCAVKITKLSTNIIDLLCILGRKMSDHMDEAKFMVQEIQFALSNSNTDQKRQNTPIATYEQRYDPRIALHTMRLGEWRNQVNAECANRATTQWQWANLWYRFLDDTTVFQEFMPSSYQREAQSDQWPIHPMDLIIDENFINYVMDEIGILLDHFPSERDSNNFMIYENTMMMDDDDDGRDDQGEMSDPTLRNPVQQYCKWKTRYQDSHPQLVHLIPEQLWIADYIAKANQAKQFQTQNQRSMFEDNQAEEDTIDLEELEDDEDNDDDDDDNNFNNNGSNFDFLQNNIDTNGQQGYTSMRSNNQAKKDRIHRRKRERLLRGVATRVTLWTAWIQWTFIVSWNHLISICLQHMIAYGMGSQDICTSWIELFNSWSANQLQRYAICPAFPLFYDARLYAHGMEKYQYAKNLSPLQQLRNYFTSMQNLELFMIFQALDKTLKQATVLPKLVQQYSYNFQTVRPTNSMNSTNSSPTLRLEYLHRDAVAYVPADFSWHGLEGVDQYQLRMTLKHRQQMSVVQSFFSSSPSSSTSSSAPSPSSLSSPAISLNETIEQTIPAAAYLYSIQGATQALAQQIVGLASAESVLGAIIQDLHDDNVMYTITEDKYIYYDITYIQSNIAPITLHIAIPTGHLEWKFIDLGLSSVSINRRDTLNPSKIPTQKPVRPINVTALQHFSDTIINSLGLVNDGAAIQARGHSPLVDHIYASRDRLGYVDQLVEETKPVYAIVDSSQLLDQYYRRSVTRALIESIQFFVLMLVLLPDTFSTTYIYQSQWIVQAMQRVTREQNIQIRNLLTSLHLPGRVAPSSPAYPIYTSVTRWYEQEIINDIRPISDMFDDIFYHSLVKTISSSSSSANQPYVPQPSPPMELYPPNDIIRWFHNVINTSGWSQAMATLADFDSQLTSPATSINNRVPIVLPSPNMIACVNLLGEDEAPCAAEVMQQPRKYPYQLRFGGVNLMRRYLSEDNATFCERYWSMRRVLPVILETFKITDEERERVPADAETYCVTLNLSDTDYIRY